MLCKKSLIEERNRDALERIEGGEEPRIRKKGLGGEGFRECVPDEVLKDERAPCFIEV